MDIMTISNLLTVKMQRNAPESAIFEYNAPDIGTVDLNCEFRNYNVIKANWDSINSIRIQ